MKFWSKLLQKIANQFPAKDIGWKDVGEVFYRHSILKTRWFNIYLHKVNCVNIPHDCHDHPWHFVTLILSGGYTEESNGTIKRRNPGNILYRPAKFSHRLWTDGDAWSLVVTSRKIRGWNHFLCEA